MAKLPSEKYNLFFKEPITSWDEGIALGNGLTGCLIWGRSEHLRFSLDRGDLWDTTPAPEVLDERFTYQTMVDMALKKDTQGIRELFDKPYYHPAPTKLPAGKLIMAFEKDGKVESLLKLAQAEAEIRVIGEKGTSLIRSFSHATKGAGFIQVEGKAEFSVSLENPAFGHKGEEDEYRYSAEERQISQGNLGVLKYDRVIRDQQGELTWFVQPVDENLEYGIVLGEKVTEKGREFVYVIGASHDGENWLEDAKEKTRSLLKEGYDREILSHVQWWKAFWEKSSVTLPEELFEKNWYITNYLFGSCSRKNCPPMPLQGVWTADSDQLPPWKGDYHHDLNTQLSYAHYGKANHLEEGESFLDFLWNLVPQAQEFAKNFYHSEGLCLPAVMSINAVPLGGWGMYTLTPANQLWLAQIFERHYRYTGDRKFLEERAYPYLKGSTQCILGLMHLNEDGKYVLDASTSPEIHDDEAESWVTPNSNYDLSLIRYGVGQLIQMAEELGLEEKSHWEEVLEKLPELAVNDKNVLMLSPDESLNESHRHHSHLMAIYPLRTMGMDDEREKEIIDASILDLERLGSGFWVGFSFTWLAELYAIQRNGNGAAYQLEVFWRNFCAPNGFHLNGDYKNRGVSTFHYRPFTLESNMCAADALQEMLLQTENKKIDLFPALPEEWKEKETAFTGFRGEHGLVVSASMENGKITYLKLEAERTGTYTLICPEAETVASKLAVTYRKTEKGVLIELEEGKAYTFKACR